LFHDALIIMDITWKPTKN